MQKNVQKLNDFYTTINNWSVFYVKKKKKIAWISCISIYLFFLSNFSFVPFDVPQMSAQCSVLLEALIADIDSLGS